MKKLIALLLAVSSLAMSTSVFAFNALEVNVDENAGANGSSRNYGDSGTNGVNYASRIFRESASYNDGQYPVFRAGDFINLIVVAKQRTDINGDGDWYGTDENVAVSIPDGTPVTFICSKYEKSSSIYDNYTVQFIDQVEISRETTASGSPYNYLKYKLRESLADGMYKVELKVGELDPWTFYFLIRTPRVELLYTDAERTQPYALKNGNAYCFGKAVITGETYSFTQADATIGFTFTDKTSGDVLLTKTKGVVRNGSVPTESFADVAIASADHGNPVTTEIGGEGQYFFRMVIEEVYDVPDENLTPEQKTAIYATLPDVDVYLND